MLLKSEWKLQISLDAVIFDCDGTLSRTEGIEMLAALHDVSKPVRNLTETAMAKTGLTPEIYAKRLSLVQPTENEVHATGKKYIADLTEDAENIIRIFHALHKPVFIVSAGLLPAVRQLGNYLGIDNAHIFAVDIFFDKEGNYLDFDKDSLLVHNEGKCHIVQLLKKKYARTGFVGDGLNDCVVREHVTRFVGYGGAFLRETIAARCEFYIRSASLTPLLPLMLTEEEKKLLAAQDKKLWQKGCDLFFS